MSVTMDIADGVAVITMDDGKANALSHDLLDALTEAFADATADEDVKAILLAGRQGKFCAGFDLRVMQNEGPEAAMALLAKGGRVGADIFACPKPVVAAVTGHGIAMGALLLLCCDTRVGPQGSYKFGLNETAIDMEMPEFGLILARHRLGEPAMTAAVVQARIYDPEGAAEIGYLDLLVADDAVVDTATEIARQLGELPAKAYAKNKSVVRREAIAALMASFNG